MQNLVLLSISTRSGSSIYSIRLVMFYENKIKNNKNLHSICYKLYVHLSSYFTNYVWYRDSVAYVDSGFSYISLGPRNAMRMLFRPDTNFWCSRDSSFFMSYILGEFQKSNTYQL